MLFSHWLRQILQNIIKNSALVWFFETRRSTNCGCVCLVQNDSTLNATHCTFTRNNARLGGAIIASVGYWIQGLTALENRIHHSNDTFLYYSCLELLLYWTVTTLSWKCILASPQWNHTSRICFKLYYWDCILIS